MLLQLFDEHVGDVGKSDPGSLDEAAYNQLLLQTADTLLHDDLYYRDRWLDAFKRRPEVDEVLHDEALAGLLDEGRRTLLAFYRRLYDIVMPLKRNTGLDVGQAPFYLKDARFDIKNRELCNYLYTSPHFFLSLAMTRPLWNTVGPYFDIPHPLLADAEGKVVDDLESDASQGMTPWWELTVRTVDMMIDVDNHLELGRRLGLSSRAQVIYDVTDTFISNVYDYRQVDFAREMDAWMEANPMSEDTWTVGQIRDLVTEWDACALRHGVSFTNRRESLLTIVCDVLDLCFPDDIVVRLDAVRDKDLLETFGEEDGKLSDASGLED